MAHLAQPLSIKIRGFSSLTPETILLLSLTVLLIVGDMANLESENDVESMIWY